MSLIPKFVSGFALAVLGGGVLQADVVPAPLFQDHAVLQQGMSIPVWGTADDGERVTVTLAGRTATTTAAGGRWLVKLESLPAGGPHELVIQGKNRVALNDVLIGEVWICSGQSNMERQLGLREGQKPIRNWETETAAADYPRIRHFQAAQTIAVAPQSTVKGEWVVCSPETAHEFTAVGFFFGRAVHEAQKVPVGLIHSSWGGTPIEAWTSLGGLARIPDMAESVSLFQQLAADPTAAEDAYAKRLDAWFRQNDAGSDAGNPWSAANFDASAWSRMTLPGFWEAAGLEGVDALVWFRREIEVPQDWVNRPVELHLGAIDDSDTTWVNGKKVGTTHGWRKKRVYTLEPGTLKAGPNSIAVQVLDTGGGGGLWGPAGEMRLVRADDPTATLSLEGAWRYRLSVNFKDRPRPPMYLAGSPGAPTVLFNGMIAPLVPYAMRGVIWYQGEANASQAALYRRLMPNLVADWRDLWAQGDFPFLYVQIAPFNGMPAEIREAQLLALPKIPKAAMVVTADVGDAADIHPADKRPVGERLAVAARALAYGEKIEYSGPLFDAMKVQGSRAVLTFRHVGKGLVAPGGALKGFVIAGADKVFHPAQARIVGETVEVSAPAVSAPVAARYGWADVPEGNLFNKNGLPASPFRTDVTE